MGSVPEFLRKPIATCDFPGGGGGRGAMPPPPPPPLGLHMFVLKEQSDLGLHCLSFNHYIVHIIGY